MLGLEHCAALTFEALGPTADPRTFFQVSAVARRESRNCAVVTFVCDTARTVGRWSLATTPTSRSSIRERAGASIATLSRVVR